MKQFILPGISCFYCYPGRLVTPDVRIRDIRKSMDLEQFVTVDT